MSAPERPRLAPWRGEDGKPCYLVAAGDGFLSKLADEVEAELLAMGAELLDFAGQLLEDESARSREVRFLARRLTEALRDALLVADSRGDRLPVPEPDGERVGWNQRLPEEVRP